MNDHNDIPYDEDHPDSSSSSSSLLSSLRAPPNRHYYLTRRGKVLQSTTERYLRDDLGFGSMLVPSSSSSSDDGRNKKRRKSKEDTIAGKIVELVPYTIEHVSTLVDLLAASTTRRTSSSVVRSETTDSIILRLVVVDTNVLLHHMDVLEYLREEEEGGGGGEEKNNSSDDHGACIDGGIRHCAIANAIVIPQTALEECRHRSLVMYRRATDLVRSSSSSSSSTTTSTSFGRQRRCVIVFADVHHVDTQIKPNQDRRSAHPLIPFSTDVSSEKNDGAASNTINDENDARLRKVAWFYGRALHDFYQSRREGGGGEKGRKVQLHHQQEERDEEKEIMKQLEVVFLSDDAQSRKLALLEQPREDDDVGAESNSRSTRGAKRNGLYYKARSMREHVTLLQKEDPTLNLLDMVANFNVGPGGEGGGRIAISIDEGGGVLERVGGGYRYAPHVPSSTLSHGLRTNRYYQGVYRSNRDSYTEGYVTIRRGEDRVAVVVSGREDVNRAVDGDIVAVELYSVDRWLITTTASMGGRVEPNDGGLGATGMNQHESSSGVEYGGDNKGEQSSCIAADTAEPSLRDIENIAEEVPVNEEGQTRRPVGKVVGIIRRNFHKNFCGSICTVDDNKSNENDAVAGHPSSLHPHDAIAAKHEREHPDGITSTVVFFSIDQRVPPILLRTTQRERLVGMRILVSMDSWPADSEYPLGHYVQTLGLAGTKDTETQVLLQEFRIPCEPFPAKVLACLPPADYRIELEPGRADLRHVPVLSIDPPGCKDIDDALHCIQLDNGNWQVGVHIADVTHYVEAGTAIDLEAANRSTSTYLVNKRLDMLPSLLTTDLCSLKGNVDRYAFSVLWEVTPDATIVDVEFKKSIIHSIAALTYQQAQSLIDKPEKDCRDDIQAGAVKRLASLARKFRARRIAAGALTLASPEVKFVLDSESLNPTDVQAYTLYEANALVEEFMLLANVTVAKKILRHYPTLSILRRHPAPNRSMFDGLIQKAKTRGISLCIDDSKKLADSLDAAGRALSDDPYLDQLLRILSTRCMSPAQYFCSGEYQAKDWHHYGLAAPVYTHFTSPIRRYADVCVHRLLAAAIGVAPLPVFLSSKSHLHDLAANMNRRHRAAQLAGRASVQLHTLLFFAGGEDGEEGGGAKEEDAYVLDIDALANSEPSLLVMVPRYGIEGKVRLAHNIEGKCLVREPEKQRLDYKDLMTGKLIASVAVFDKVRVKISVRKNRDRRELVVDLLEPKLFANLEN